MTVTVTDPGGGSDQGTFTLTVNNTNDPPFAFDLITPAQHESVDSVPIDFTWEPGDDPDPAADFYYSVYFDDDSIMVANHYSEIASWIQTPFTEHPSPLPHPGPWYWRVQTWDSQEWGRDSPVQRFHYTPPPVQSTGGNRSGPEDQSLSFSGHSTSPFGQLEYTVSHAVQSDTPELAVSIEEPLDWNDWEITCTPAPNWNGTAQLTLTATGEGGGVSTETILVTITPVNDLPSTPVLQYPANAGYVFTPETTLQWASSTDVDTGATISYNVYMALSPTNMGQPANLQGNTTATSFTLEPVGFGPWYWGITTLGGLGGTRNSSIRSFIVDLPPTIAGLVTPEMGEDGTLELTYADIEAYFTTIAWSVGCDVPQVNMVVTDSSDLVRTLTFTPDPDWHGNAQFHLTATDGHGNSDTLAGLLTVLPVNDAPAAQAFDTDTDEDTPVALPFSGADSLAFVASDSLLDSDPAWIRILVLNQDDCPVQTQPFVSPNASEPDQESVFIFTSEWLVSHFSDPDGDPLTASETSVTVPADAWGDFPVSWQVSAGGCTLEGVFQLAVQPLNDAPVYQFCGLDCEGITDLETFAEAWSSAGLTLQDIDGDSLTVTWFVDNQPVCTQTLDSTATCLEFCLDLAPYIENP